MTFSRIVKEFKRKSKEFKIVVVGLDNSGKTTIIHSLFNHPIDSISPTFGYYSSLWDYKDTRVQILDVGGQSLFREYWDSYFDKADGIIYVYDLSQEDSAPYLEEILRNVDIPILVFGNKMDLVGESEDLAVESGDLVGQCSGRVNHFICSGTKRINLEEGMDWLISECRRMN